MKAQSIVAVTLALTAAVSPPAAARDVPTEHNLNVLLKKKANSAEGLRWRGLEARDVGVETVYLGDKPVALGVNLQPGTTYRFQGAGESYCGGLTLSVFDWQGDVLSRSADLTGQSAFEFRTGLTSANVAVEVNQRSRAICTITILTQELKSLPRTLTPRLSGLEIRVPGLPSRGLGAPARRTPTSAAPKRPKRQISHNPLIEISSVDSGPNPIKFSTEMEFDHYALY